MMSKAIQQVTFLILFLFQGSVSGTRSLQSRWDILGPTFDYENYVITMEYLINNEVGEREVWYSLFDGEGCKEEAKPLERNSKFLQSEIGVKASAGGNMLAKVSLELDPQEIVESPIFHSHGATSAEIVFCVRFGLYSGDHNSDSSIEVNFVETPVQVQLNMKGGSNLTIGEIKNYA